MPCPITGYGPPSPFAATPGTFYIDYGTRQLYYSQNGQWILISGGGNAVPHTIQVLGSTDGGTTFPTSATLNINPTDTLRFITNSIDLDIQAGSANVFFDAAKFTVNNINPVSGVTVGDINFNTITRNI